MALVHTLSHGDNYIYCIVNNSNVMVIDPGVAEPVLQFLAENNLTLKTILVTHNHSDHIGGVTELTHQTGCKTFSSKNTEITAGGISVTVIPVPGHTSDHVAFYLPATKTVFTGDTLFVAGCGRLFGGSAAQMYRSLQTLATLGDDVLVYCGHDYTEENLRFALTIEPDNLSIEQKLENIRDFVTQGQPTTPSTIAEEKLTNVFLRARSVEEFALLRKKKDSFG